MAILLFLSAGGAAAGLGRLFSWTSPSIGLNKLGVTVSCAMAEGQEQRVRSLHLYAAHARWSAVFLLLALVSAVAVVVALATLAGIWREAKRRDVPTRWNVVGISVALVAACVWQFLKSPVPVLNEAGASMSSNPGLLSYLVTTLRSVAGCQELVSQVWTSKRLGEAAGLVVGAAMTATAAPLVKRERLVDRIRQVQHLLYVGSLLFVAGMLITQSNFSWITATWVSLSGDAHASNEIADLVSAATIQSGVGYSAMLALFFLPARAYLGWQVEGLPEAERKIHDEAAKQVGLGGPLSESAKQILALLAPILSAPVLDALLKSH